jgi:hypothetical protein
MLTCRAGFLGNLLVVLVVVLNSKMRNTTNLLILNLAVTCHKILLKNLKIAKAACRLQRLT